MTSPLSSSSSTIEQQFRTTTTWTVPSILSALSEHERGDFTRSAQLAEHMLRDSRIRSGLDTRVLGMLGLPFDMEPSLDGDQRRAAMVAEAAERWWRKRMRARQTAKFIRWALLMGATPGRLPWTETKDGKSWLPRLQFWHPQHLRWRELERDWTIETRDGIQPLKPGDGEWVLFAPGGDEWPWSDGLVRVLAIPWVCKMMCEKDWSRATEVYGMGIRKAKVPKIDKPEIVKKFFRDVKNLGREPVIKLPEGFDVEVAMVEAGKGDSFSKLIEYCDQAITIGILGQTLTTVAKTASDSTATGQQGVQLDRLEADAENWGDFCEEQVLTPYAIRNFGDGELAPRPCYDATPPVDQNRSANCLQTASTAVVALRGGKIVSVNEARRMLAATTGFELPDLDGGDKSPLDEPALATPALGAPPPAPPPDPIDDRQPG